MCTIKPGTQIGIWKIPSKPSNIFSHSDANITVGDKIGNNYKTESEAIKAAAAKETQSAIVNEKDGTFSLYEVDDGSYTADFNSRGSCDSNEFRDRIKTNQKGLALGVIGFVDEDGKFLENDSSIGAKQIEKGIDDLKSLTKSHNTDDRIKAAKSINVSPELFRKMFNDPDVKVKIALAGNVAAPPDVLKKLFEENDINIKKALAGNYAIPKDLSIKLAKDSSKEVKIILTKDLDKDPLLNNDDLFKGHGVVNHLKIKTEHDEILADLKNKLKEANDHKPEILKILVKDKDPDVRANAKKLLDLLGYLKD